jgi:hypothetical protein
MVTHYFTFFIKIASYEYTNFQFSQNDKYAQRLCIYIFSDFITYKKPKIDVCVMCLHCALKENSDLLQSAKYKAQTFDCAPAFANPNL